MLQIFKFDTLPGAAQKTIMTDFYKFWDQELSDGNLPNFLYKIDNLGFSFFISNLVDWLSNTSVIENSNLWFPTDKTILTTKTF